jgi:hypothetical protein
MLTIYLNHDIVYLFFPIFRVFLPDLWYSKMSAPVPVPIAVNFNVEIDASGNLNVFSAPAQTASNVIVAEQTLPVSALYDPVHAEGPKGLLELWEPSAAQGDIEVQLANTNLVVNGGLDLSNAYQHAAKELAKGFEAILCNTFDCSGAAPFSAYKTGASADKYYKQRDFGRVALATYAHHLFGHVDATAAITNDKAFVEAMLSLSAAGDSEVAADRVAAYKTAKLSAINGTDVEAWSDAADTTDANLAIRLVKALVGKGLDAANGNAKIVSAVSAGNSASLANIVSQVVGQDASRLMDVDNSQRTLDKHMLLRFYAGDVFYINVKLTAPNVSVGTGQLVSKSALESMYPSASNNFSIKITLA